MPRYAVTGSTGHLGPLVIAGMLRLGIAPDDIVAVARTPAKAAALTEAGLQVRYRPDPLLPRSRRHRGAAGGALVSAAPRAD